MQKTIIRTISELSKRMADVEAFVVVEQDTPVQSIPTHLAFEKVDQYIKEVAGQN